MEVTVGKELKVQKTELDHIPHDWIATTFGETFTGFSSGMTPFRGVLEYYTGKIPWITSGELNYNLIEDTWEKITEEAVIKTNLKIHPVGTFLMAITGLEAAGTRGSCAITGIKATTNQSCMALFPIKGKTTTKYLYHFYVYYGNELAFKYCQGTKQQSYTGRIVKRLPIHLPPTLTEQKSIAQVLSDTDSLIQALEKKIAKKKLIKKGMMQKLLIPKKDWEVKVLGELAEFYKGRGLPKSQIIQEGKYKCLHYGELFTKYKEEIKTIFSKTNTLENVFFSKSNDVLMPTSDVTPNGLATASCIREDNIILGGDVLVIRISNQIINGIFLSYFITQNRRQVMQLVSGSTVYHLYGSDMSKFVLSYPKIEEQNLIVQILSDIDKEISHLEKKLSKYQLAKQGMMQQLLTGKIRLV
jgi:type I restriction enzyme S subunit